jgi:ABC-2 type transport system ATP-binding protein
MREYLKRFQKMGKTVLLPSHLVEDIYVICDTVVEMEKGRLIV